MAYGKYVLAGAIAVSMLSAPAFAAGDPVKGKAVFARCAICHTAEKDAGNGVGPDLFGVVGRKSATEPDFSYSAPMKASGIVWTEANLTKWLSGPARMVPGTKMAFPGITSKSQIADVVAYLGTLK